MFQLKNVKLRPKLIMLFLIVALFPWEASRSINVLKQAAFRQLESVHSNQATAVEAYFRRNLVTRDLQAAGRGESGAQVFTDSSGNLVAVAYGLLSPPTPHPAECLQLLSRGP